MLKFVITGGELTDPMIPESLYKFSYTLFAKNVEEAKEMFATIFPGCSLEAMAICMP